MRPPVVQESGQDIPKCGLCNIHQLTPEHHKDWDLWLMIGAEEQSVRAAIRYLGIYVRWSAVHFGDKGASIPICNECRIRTIAHLQGVCMIADQSHCASYHPPLHALGRCNEELFIAYKMLAKQMAAQLYLKTTKLEMMFQIRVWAAEMLNHPPPTREH
jgi:integral membrane sensor domain MASE1